LIVRAFQIGFLKVCLPPLLIILFSCGTYAASAQAPPPDALGTKNILILHALEANMPLNVRTDRAIMESLQAGGVGLKAQFYEYLDLHRHPGAKHRQRLAEMLRERYDDHKIDAIITLYPEALQFVLDEGRTIFPDAPIVALYMYPGFEASKTGRRIVQHVLRNDIAGTLESALKLVPEAKSVYVVSGVHPLDKKNEAQARLDLQKWEGRLNFRYLSDMPLEEMLAAISSAPRETIILYLAVSADNTGTTYNPRDVAERLSQVANGPVFGLYESILGYGIVGGSLVSYDDIGTQAGQLTLSFLKIGSDPHKVPAILDVPGVLKFDWRQLKRWNLSVDAVPAGSIIINREYTVWERYRTEVIVAFFVLVVQALLIVSLVVRRAQRQRAERQLAQQLQVETLLAELSARFVNVPAGQIESEIHNAQRRICDVLDLDRSTLFQVPRDEPGNLRLTHIHTPAETAPLPVRADGRDLFPWALQKLMRGETLTISTLAKLPLEAAKDRENIQRYGTKSVVAIPLVAEGTVFGALTFAAMRAEREWPEDIVKGFRMVAEVIANALARKRADETLRETQARLTLAAASAEARLWEVDANTGRVWMTEEGRAFYGMTSPEAMTLDQVASFIHADDRERWRQSIWQGLESGQPMRTEFRVIRPDGSVRWFVAQGRPHVDGAGKPRRMLGVSIDVTERRQVEERLRTSEALSIGVLASLPGHMAIVDRSGSILRTSDTWQTFAAGDGALDPTVLAVGAKSPQARPRAGEQAGPVVKEIQGGIDAVLTGTQADFRLDYAYPTRTDERWASVSVLPLQRPEGGAVIYCQDITTQQRSRLEAERLRRDLTHVGRVTTMGEMAAALAHELNQPLTAILSNAHAGERYLAQAVPPLDEIRELLQDVMGDARRAGEVIQRLRSLLRKEEVRFRPLDVNQVVQEIATLLHTETVIRNVVLDLDLAPELPVVRGDRIQLQQVLLNLVLNGMEAIGPIGEGRRIVLQTLQADGTVRIAVRDQGPGIPGDKLSHIFETFYTTKQDGMGMGLAISRSIVEAHGGRIWAENNPDGGATVSFGLPVCPPNSALV
jgi:PAS domain S-box-containing protein